MTTYYTDTSIRRVEFGDDNGRDDDDDDDDDDAKKIAELEEQLKKLKESQREKQRLRQQQFGMDGSSASSTCIVGAEEETAANNIPMSTVIAKRGSDTKDADRQLDPFRPSLIHSQLKTYKEHESCEIGEDVYAFVVVAPVYSMPFVFAMAVIFLKYLVYAVLLWDTVVLALATKDDFDLAYIAKTAARTAKECFNSCAQYGNANATTCATTCAYATANADATDELQSANTLATVVKFFLIPVAVAMQSDLMAVYASLSNVRYSNDVHEISKSATEFKFYLAYLLRFIDGMLSLVVNVLVMLTTHEVLAVFLNFAALHFLQAIDDVFYVLVEKGFFGDKMEYMSTVCHQVSWPRRSGSKKSRWINRLDTILFCTTLFSVYVAYIWVTILIHR